MTNEKVETPSEVAELKMELQRQVTFWQQSSKEWKQAYERQAEHSGQLRAELEATRKTRTEQFFEIGQLQQRLEALREDNDLLRNGHTLAIHRAEQAEQGAATLREELRQEVRRGKQG